jgi:quercetin dioxygenase-like cupin family protein
MSVIESRPAVTNSAFITKGPGREVRYTLGPGPEKVFHLLADASQTNRRCTVALHQFGANEQVPFHMHSLEDEGFFVLEGDITFLMPHDDCEIHAGPGEFVWHPNNRAHSFRTGDKPVKMLQFLLPGTELVPGFFEDVSGLQTPEELAAVADMSLRRYGTRQFGPEVPPPSTRAGVTRGPVTPDARMLVPDEVDRMVNAPFKSDASKKYSLTIGRGVMTGVELIFHAWGHQTGGIFQALEIAWSKPDMVYPHVHPLEEEAFYILEGEFTVYVAEADGITKAVAQPGDFVWAPRDMPHFYHVTGNEGARVLTVFVPGASGFLNWFYEMAVTGRGADLSTDEKFREFDEWAGKAAGSVSLAEGEWPGEIPSP